MQQNIAQHEEVIAELKQKQESRVEEIEEKERAIEAMKMETTFVSKVNGKVDKLYVAPGDRVNTEDLLISFVLDEEEEK